MFDSDEEDDDRDLTIRLPMDIDPSRIKIELNKNEEDLFIIKVSIVGPFTDEEQQIIDGLCEAIEEEEEAKDVEVDIRRLN